MKTLLIYEKLVTLHREAHRALRVQPSEQKYSFARETNSLLIAASELPQAVLDYPCVFIQAGEDHAMAALVGLRDRENLFIDEQGEWQAGSYVPAFVRRYPFVLADTEQADEFTVCIDETYPGLNEAQGQRLFEDDGSETDWLQQAKQFLLNFRQEAEQSRLFANRLAELGLLQERVVEYQHTGHKASLSGFKVVDEQKLLALPPEQVQELLGRGWLGLIYAHLLSIQQVQRLADRLGRRTAALAAAEPATNTLTH